MGHQKSDQQIKDEYAALLKKAKLICVIVVLLILPRLVLNFSSLETFMGFNINTALIPLGIGVIICVCFYYFFWRCPACNKLPGDSWSKTRCKNCDVALK